MSEVMSSSDIEDVLSSIRRLVTGDLRPRVPAAAPAIPAQDAAGAASGAPEQVQAPAGRLLLTPALRVVPSAAPPAPPSAPRPPIDGVLSLIGARVAPPPTGFEAETGDAFDAAAEAGPPRPVAAATFTLPNPAARPEEAAASAEPDPQMAATAGKSPAPMAAAAAEDKGEDEDGVPEPVVDIDEETLRELIRDVLREELQGPMGERITRNIRKLVRAELARAAALRQVD